MVKCGLSSLIYKPAVGLCKAKSGGGSALTWFYITYLTGPGWDQGTRKMSRTTVMIPVTLISAAEDEGQLIHLLIPSTVFVD